MRKLLNKIRSMSIYDRIMFGLFFIIILTGFPIVLPQVMLSTNVDTYNHLSDEYTKLRFLTLQTNVNPPDTVLRKFRVAYIEGGQYPLFDSTLKYMFEGLMELGWIDYHSIPDMSAEELWNYASLYFTSKYLIFSPDAFYTCNWNNDILHNYIGELITRTDINNEFDLIIAMGTFSSRLLDHNIIYYPVLVAQNSNPKASDLVNSNNGLISNNVIPIFDPDREVSQIRIFYNLFKFETLGIAHQYTEQWSRDDASLDQIERLSKELGFEIEYCLTTDSDDMQMDEQMCLNCYENLAKRVDAVYVTWQNGVNKRTVPKIANIFKTHKIPSCSQLGDSEVKQGLLFTVYPERSQFPIGYVLAANIAKSLNRTSLDELQVVLHDPKLLVLNFDTAKQIGLNLSPSILRNFDIIY